MLIIHSINLAPYWIKDVEEEHWDCHIEVDALNIVASVNVSDAPTEQDVRNWLDSHYPELQEQAVKVHGMAKTNRDLFREIMPSATSKQEYLLSFIAGLTPQQVDSYIDNNVTNLVEARTFLKKLSKVVLLLAKETRLDT